jgi:hypothetical protein
VVGAAKLDKQEGPQREADRQKKETDDLEVTRQKNQKSFSSAVIALGPD